MRRTERRKRDQKLKKNKKINLTVTNSELHIFSLLQNCQLFYNEIDVNTCMSEDLGLLGTRTADRGLTACAKYSGIQKKASDTGFGARKNPSFCVEMLFNCGLIKGVGCKGLEKFPLSCLKSALDYCNGLAPIQKFFIISKKSAFSHWFC